MAWDGQRVIQKSGVGYPLERILLRRQFRWHRFSISRPARLLPPPHPQARWTRSNANVFSSVIRFWPPVSCWLSWLDWLDDCNRPNADPHCRNQGIAARIHSGDSLWVITENPSGVVQINNLHKPRLLRLGLGFLDGRKRSGRRKALARDA